MAHGHDQATIDGGVFANYAVTNLMKAKRMDVRTLALSGVNQTVHQSDLQI
ncbi:hypothetical protein HMPREF3208_00733 [Gardnerella vaginalis]|uniref:Uncharacterized protein n=1 Tax=Gardnerella vaginalis TaxID=2702 RepID=A0A133NWL5_GARVA|nr:hypothetical protein HMPREF3208_00733 [Gardnerella vaginalis]